MECPKLGKDGKCKKRNGKEKYKNKNEQVMTNFKKKLHVSNLREDVTEEELVLYFEQPHFHPKSFGNHELEDFLVKVIHFDKKQLFTIIELPDSADISLYLNANHSNLLGNIKVKLKKKDSKQSNTSLDSFQNPKDGNVRKPKEPGTYQKRKQFPYVDNEMEGAMKLMSLKLDRVDQSMSQHHQQFQQIPKHQDHYEVFNITNNYDQPFQKSGDGLLPTPYTILDHSFLQHNQRSMLQQNLWQQQHFQHQQQLQQQYPNRQQQHTQHHHQQQPQHQQHPQPYKNQQTDATLHKKFDDKEEIWRKCQFKLLLNVENEYMKEKRLLLKKLLGGVKEQFGDGLKIWIDNDNVNHKVGVGCHDDTINLPQVSLHINEILCNMCSSDVSLPPSLVAWLTNHKGFRWINEFFDQHNLKVVAYKNSSNGLSVVGENKQSANMGARLLEEDCEERLVTLKGRKGGVPIQHFNGDRWNELVHYINSNYFSVIHVQFNGTQKYFDEIKINVTGFKSSVGFEIAINSVKEEVSKLDGCSVISDDLPHTETCDNKFSANFSNKNALKFDNSQPNQNAKQKVGNSSVKKLQMDTNQQTHDKEAQKKNHKISVGLSLLEFRFFKQEFPDVVNKKTKYNMDEHCLEITGDEVECQRRKSLIEERLSTLYHRDLTLNLPCLTIGFYNENKSSFRDLLTHVGKITSCVFDVKSAGDQADNKESLIIECCGPINLDHIDSLLTDKLKVLIQEKNISFSFVLDRISNEERLLDEDLISKLKELTTANVVVEIDNLSEFVLLKGRSCFLNDVETSVNNLFLEYLKNYSSNKKENTSSILTLEDPLRMIHPSEFLKSYAHQDIQAPPHWVTYQGSLKTVSNIKGSLHELSTFSPLHNLITSLVTSSWREEVVGLGKDARGLKHKNIKITKIYSVENVCQYKRYMMKIKEFCLQHHDQAAELSKQTQSILTRKIIDDTKKLLHEINECYLFHGMNGDKIQAIVDQGFDFRLASSRSLFGQGIYFAESATKADQYADDRKNRSPAGKFLSMFVSRVFLGHMHHCKRPKPFKRPPCSNENCQSEVCNMHPMCDSVMGTKTYVLDQNQVENLLTIKEQLKPENFDTLKLINDKLSEMRDLLFREFVVYDRSQCYPEFLIEYIRV